MSRLNNDQIKENMLDTLHKLQTTMKFFNIRLGTLEDCIKLNKLDRDLLIAFYIHLGLAYEQIEYNHELFGGVDKLPFKSEEVEYDIQHN